MKPLLVFVVGATIFGLTFAGWLWINTLACGMNPTGCHNFRLAWHDWEALQFFAPTFLIGMALMAAGLFKMLARGRTDGE